MRAIFSSLSVAVALIALTTTLEAQYGPKDGQDLPPADLERVKVGQTAPDFTLPGLSGAPLTLSSLRGKNVVLVFYRGHW